MPQALCHLAGWVSTTDDDRSGATAHQTGQQHVSPSRSPTQEPYNGQQSMKALRKVRDRLGHHERDEDAAREEQLSKPFSLGSKDNIHLDNEDEKETSKLEALKRKANSIKRVVVHPGKTLKEQPQRKLTDQFILTERPWLEDEQKADRKLEEAYDTLNLVKEGLRKRPGDAVLLAKVRDAETRIHDLEEKREEIEVAWHMSRYVHRARVVRHAMPAPQTDAKAYVQHDPDGNNQRFLWMKWLGHLVLFGFRNTASNYIDPTNEVPYSSQELIRNIERLLVTSQGFQFWWNRVRNIYRWEDPWLTAKWFLLFVVLLKTGYFMTFYYSYMLYSYVSNIDGKHTRRWLFESGKRVNDTHSRAVMLSELIIRHGQDAWFEPVMEEMGPWLQEQALDLAQLMEIFNNYYVWRNKSAGMNTCFLYVCLALVCAIPSLEFSIRVFWFSCGLFFFLGRPIASLYPRFRHAVDPIRWLYWNHPTQSEFCFLWLRNHAPVVQTHGDLETDIDSDSAGGSDSDETFQDCYSDRQDTSGIDRTATVLAWRAYCSKRRGRLELTHLNLRFVTRQGENSGALWSRPLVNLLELQKHSFPRTELLSGPSLSKLSKSSDALSVLWLNPETELALDTVEEITNDRKDVEETVLYGMQKDARDEAFNAIIALSSLSWQELQLKAESDLTEALFK